MVEKPIQLRTFILGKILGKYSTHYHLIERVNSIYVTKQYYLEKAHGIKSEPSEHWRCPDILNLGWPDASHRTRMQTQCE